MVVNHFLKWIDTARVSERAAAAAALARAFLGGELAFEDRCAAEAALTLLLDDPSEKVRQAMAEVLSLSRRAPAQVIHALAADQVEVAAPVLTRSPLVTDADLVDRVAGGDDAIQCCIAARPAVSMQVAAAICEVGVQAACLALLRNGGAAIASLSFRRLAERFGAKACVREALLAHCRLPADCRHLLLVKLGEALRGAPLMVGLLGAARAERITQDACARSSLTLIDATRAEERMALVEHLRLRGDITTAFVIRLVAHGKIDFFGAVLVSLSGYEHQRVRMLLASGRDVALAALFRAAGLGAAANEAVTAALKTWRDVANGKRFAGAQEVSWLMLKELDAAPGQSGPAARHEKIAALIRTIHLETLRQNAREHARAIAAA